MNRTRTKERPTSKSRAKTLKGKIEERAAKGIASFQERNHGKERNEKEGGSGLLCCASPLVDDGSWKWTNTVVLLKFAARAVWVLALIRRFLI